MAAFDASSFREALVADDADAVWDALEADPSLATADVGGETPRGLCPSEGKAAAALDEFAACARLRAEHPSASLRDCRRFSRARNGDHAKATAFLGADTKWRESFKPSAVAQSDLPVALSTGAWRVLGMSDVGSPVLLVSTRLWNPHLYGIDEYAKYVAYFCEGLARMGDKFVVLFDMSGWRMKHALELKKVAKLVDTVQNHYPERLEAALMLRAPRIFAASWSVIKTFVDAQTAEKIRWPKAPQEAEAFAAASVPLAILPTDYGGARREADCPVPGIPGEPDVVVVSHN